MPAVELRAFLDDYLNRQQQANAELARSHYLGLRVLLRDIRDSQGHISHQMERIMSVISDFAAAVKAFQARQDAAVDGLVVDVKTLNDKITELQNSGGAVSDEDKALLDEIKTHAGVIADKVDALDAQTPPPAPPVTP
jgi:hypothetical protein